MSAVAAVVVSWNTRALLGACLDSLARHAPGAPVVVVDNASSDGSAEMVRGDHPGVRLIANAENLGFAGGVNRGVDAVDADAVLVLNADAELRPGALETMRAVLEAEPRRALVGPRLVHPDGRPQESRTPFPTVRGELRTLVRARAGGGTVTGVESVTPHPALRPAWYLMGAALLIRRTAWEDVGPLDEAYFFYLEEVDWFLRAYGLGWGWARALDAEVVHHLGASLKAADPLVEAKVKRNWNRSRLRFFRRHHGPFAGAAYRCGAAVPLALNALRHGLRGAGGDPEARVRAAVARGILADTLLGRDARC